MAISMQKARSLCTQSELNLVKWSSPKQIKTLTPSQLKQKIDRARKLRDKFKDLSRKQAGEARGKRKPTGTRPAKGNERTVEKRELFEEVITRFENAMTKAEETKAKAAKKSAAKKKTKKKAASKKKRASKSASNKSSKKKIVKKKTSGRKRRESVGSVSLGGGSASASSVFSGAGTSLAKQTSRETRRKSASKSSQGGREQSRFARTSQEKIQGHVSASTRRSQAKRDAK